MRFRLPKLQSSRVAFVSREREVDGVADFHYLSNGATACNDYGRRYDECTRIYSIGVSAAYYWLSAYGRRERVGGGRQKIQIPPTYNSLRARRPATVAIPRFPGALMFERLWAHSTQFVDGG